MLLLIVLSSLSVGIYSKRKELAPLRGAFRKKEIALHCFLLLFSLLHLPSLLRADPLSEGVENWSTEKQIRRREICPRVKWQEKNLQSTYHTLSIHCAKVSMHSDWCCLPKVAAELKQTARVSNYRRKFNGLICHHVSSECLRVIC